MMSKKKFNSSWPRVTGDNLHPQNALLAQANKSVLANPIFLKACTDFGVEPTKRQASKFRRRIGKAYHGKTQMSLRDKS